MQPCSQKRLKFISYACNDDHDSGPNMLSVSKINWTQYACNLKAKTDFHACNLFLKGSNMPAMSKIVPESRDYDFCNNLVKLNLLRLQAYLVPFVIKIVSIFGPCRNNYCNHMWFIPIPKSINISKVCFSVLSLLSAKLFFVSIVAVLLV